MTTAEWLDTIRREYLEEYIGGGGAAVKFVVYQDDQSPHILRRSLRETAGSLGYQFALVSSATTKIHLIDKLFHEIARQADWELIARQFLRRTLAEAGFTLPEGGGPVQFAELARLNGRDETLLRNEIRFRLEHEVYQDSQLSYEFRIAMLHLCLAQLEPADPDIFLNGPIQDWLRGELPRISALKNALIFQKVARHSARHMLLSLAHWLVRAGSSGLLLMLEMDRYVMARPRSETLEGFYYGASATLDAYETLRQFIDATDEMENCLIVVTAPTMFLTDDGRGMNAYDALKMRIADEVHDRARQNPLGALIRLSCESEMRGGQILTAESAETAETGGST